jgi:hypothetical protein
MDDTGSDTFVAAPDDAAAIPIAIMSDAKTAGLTMAYLHSTAGEVL